SLEELIQPALNNDGFIANANVGAADIEGVEVEFQGALTNNLVLRASLTHNDGDVSADSYEDHGSLTFNYSSGAWNVNLGGIYRSSIDIPDTFSEGSYFLVNTNIRYSFSERFSINAGAFNLFDEEYRTFSPSLGDFFNFEIPNRGIESFIGLKGSW
nr:TonB-dependent receptor [Acidobacteriota bacterium]